MQEIDTSKYQFFKLLLLILFLFCVFIFGSIMYSHYSASGDSYICASFFLILGLLVIFCWFFGIFSSGVKFTDSGVYISPQWLPSKEFIPYKDMKSISFSADFSPVFAGFFSFVTITKPSGFQTVSDDQWLGVDGIKKVVDDVKPILEKNGFKLKKKIEEKRHYEYVFE